MRQSYLILGNPTLIRQHLYIDSALSGLNQYDHLFRHWTLMIHMRPISYTDITHTTTLLLHTCYQYRNSHSSDKTYYICVISIGTHIVQIRRSWNTYVCIHIGKYSNKTRPLYWYRTPILLVPVVSLSYQNFLWCLSSTAMSMLI